MKTMALIFSGFNQRAVIAFLRTLDNNSLTYAIIANSLEDSILSSRYAGSVAAIREFMELNLDDMIARIAIAREKVHADNFSLFLRARP